jgi:hypothetical protein
MIRRRFPHRSPSRKEVIKLLPRRKVGTSRFVLFLTIPHTRSLIAWTCFVPTTGKMAEALGLVASIIAVVQLAESIARTCTFLIESIEGCPRDLRLILLEASAIKALFQNLEFMKKHDPEAAVFLNGIEGSVTGCLESITELENLIPHTIPLAAARKRKRPKTYLTLASLAWPLKRAKAKSLLHIISQHKATISAMISAEALYVFLLMPIG